MIVQGYWRIFRRSCSGADGSAAKFEWHVIESIDQRLRERQEIDQGRVCQVEFLFPFAF